MFSKQSRSLNERQKLFYVERNTILESFFRENIAIRKKNEIKRKNNNFISVFVYSWEHRHMTTCDRVKLYSRVKRYFPTFLCSICSSCATFAFFSPFHSSWIWRYSSAVISDFFLFILYSKLTFCLSVPKTYNHVIISSYHG